MVSRRSILKSIALIGLSTAAAGAAPRGVRAQQPGLPSHWLGQPLARITGEYMNVRAEPSVDAAIVSELYQDDVVRVRRVVNGQTVFLYNDLWLETRYGYLYSSFVQPLWYHLPNPVISQKALGTGLWAQVTTPYSDAYWDTAEAGRDDPTFAGRMYYDSVHRVVDVLTGRDGKTWYAIDELYGAFYMRATHLRIIPPAELAPISPEVPADLKRIEVDLSAQTLTAYEGSDVMLRHRIATGREGKETPTGTHFVVDKRPSDRMTNGTAALEEDEELYNLAGVPYVSYFTWDWHAFHGTYWHNDYGQQRSAGCVNLPPHVAKWLWRWTTPTAPVDEFYYRVNVATEGTRVIVF